MIHLSRASGYPVDIPKDFLTQKDVYREKLKKEHPNLSIREIFSLIDKWVAAIGPTKVIKDMTIEEAVATYGDIVVKPRTDGSYTVIIYDDYVE